MRRALLILSACLIAACSEKSQPIERHDVSGTQPGALQREDGEGPYVSGNTETFSLVLGAEQRGVRWSASAGALNSSGARATWKLPAPGTASLSATVTDATGAEQTFHWDFHVASATDSLAVAREALLATPIGVDAGTPDLAGSQCQLAYEGTSKVHLAFRNDTHPSLWYGVWNGTSWTVEMVDGMGFDTGGLVETRFSMVIGAGGVPHFAYSLEGKGLWYATKSGGTWTRERVDSSFSLAAAYPQVSIGLDPSRSNRPTIAYQNYLSSYRVAIAARTGPGTWTNTRVTLGSATHQYLKGDLAISPTGTVYVPHDHSLGTYDFTSAASFALNAALSADWTQMVWAGAGKLAIRTTNQILHVTLGAALANSTVSISKVEATGVSVGDLEFQSKPYLLHLHGSNLELVTTNAQNYLTYTQLGTSKSGAMPSLAVNSAGTVSVCYQSPSGQLMFQ